MSLRSKINQLVNLSNNFIALAGVEDFDIENKSIDFIFKNIKGSEEVLEKARRTFSTIAESEESYVTTDGAKAIADLIENKSILLNEDIFEEVDDQVIGNFIKELSDNLYELKALAQTYAIILKGKKFLSEKIDYIYEEYINNENGDIFIPSDMEDGEEESKIETILNNFKEKLALYIGSLRRMLGIVPRGNKKDSAVDQLERLFAEIDEDSADEIDNFNIEGTLEYQSKLDFIKYDMQGHSFDQAKEGEDQIDLSVKENQSTGYQIISETSQVDKLLKLENKLKSKVKNIYNQTIQLITTLRTHNSQIIKKIYKESEFESLDKDKNKNDIEGVIDFVNKALEKMKPFVNKNEKEEAFYNFLKSAKITLDKINDVLKNENIIKAKNQVKEFKEKIRDVFSQLSTKEYEKYSEQRRVLLNEKRKQRIFITQTLRNINSSEKSPSEKNKFIEELERQKSNEKLIKDRIKELDSKFIENNGVAPNNSFYQKVIERFKNFNSIQKQNYIISKYNVSLGDAKDKISSILEEIIEIDNLEVEFKAANEYIDRTMVFLSNNDKKIESYSASVIFDKQKTEKINLDSINPESYGAYINNPQSQGEFNNLLRKLKSKGEYIKNITKTFNSVKINQGVGRGLTLETILKRKFNELESKIQADKLNKNTNNFNETKRLITDLENYLESLTNPEKSSAYKSKDFVGEKGELASTVSVDVSLNKLQNTMSAVITQNFAKAAFASVAFNDFIESDQFKQILEARRQFSFQNKQQYIDQDFKGNFQEIKIKSLIDSLLKDKKTDEFIKEQVLSKFNLVASEKIDSYIQEVKEIKEKNKKTKQYSYAEETQKEFFRSIISVIESHVVKYKKENYNSFINIYRVSQDVNNEIISLKTLINKSSEMIESNLKQTISPNVLSTEHESEIDEIVNLILSEPELANKLKINKINFSKEQINYLENSTGKHTFTLPLMITKIEEIKESLETNGNQYIDSLSEFSIIVSKESITEYKVKLNNALLLTEKYIESMEKIQEALQNKEEDEITTPPVAIPSTRSTTKTKNTKIPEFKLKIPTTKEILNDPKKVTEELSKSKGGQTPLSPDKTRSIFNVDTEDDNIDLSNLGSLEDETVYNPGSIENNDLNDLGSLEDENIDNPGSIENIDLSNLESLEDETLQNPSSGEGEYIDPDNFSLDLNEKPLDEDEDEDERALRDMERRNNT